MRRVEIGIDDETYRQLEAIAAGGRFKDVSGIVQHYVADALAQTTVRQAVILAGGKGTRLAPITYELPKPLIPFRGKPLMAHTIELLRRAGIYDIIICAGYKAEQIINEFGDGSRFGVTLTYVVEDEPMGTAGALHLARPHLRGSFIVTNADELKDIDLLDMMRAHFASGATGTVALTKVEDPSAYGVVEIEDGMIKRFVEKPTPEEAPSNLINAGLYMFSPEVFSLIPEGRFSMTEQDVFPKLAQDGKLSGYPFDGQWFDTGTFERYETALASWKGFRS